MTGESVAPKRPIGVAVVGFGWMGEVHTPRIPGCSTTSPTSRCVRSSCSSPTTFLAGQTRQRHSTASPPRRSTGATSFLIRGSTSSSVTAPNFLHHAIGTAMVEAGKHLWIEKPVGLDAADARVLAEAAGKAGVHATVGFNYRNVPAVETARSLIQSGGIGRVTHARFRLFSDYAAHPDSALTWRFELERGGRGVLGDLASHGVDLACYLLGELESLVSDTAIFVPERPRPLAATAGHARATGGEVGPVENEDYVACLLHFASGARSVLEACRTSVGEQNNYGFEIHGTTGAVFWDFRHMGELGISQGTDYQDQPVRTRCVGPGDGAYGAFQPGSAVSMGFDDLKVIEAHHILHSIESGVPEGPTLADAVRSAEALDAMLHSVEQARWIDRDRGSTAHYPTMTLSRQPAARSRALLRPVAPMATDHTNRRANKVLRTSSPRFDDHFESSRIVTLAQRFLGLIETEPLGYHPV